MQDFFWKQWIELSFIPLAQTCLIKFYIQYFFGDPALLTVQ